MKNFENNIQYCKNCLMPSSRPRIIFDKEICNACKYKNSRKKINYKERDAQLVRILNKFRSKKNEHDCIVPWSGGKDSSYIAYQLKFKYGMKPLLATFSPLIPTQVGINNRKKLLDLGFDHIIFKPDRKVSSYLAKRFFEERGNPKVAWDAGINSFPIKLAIEKRIKLIFYAEHGESHYGGKVLNKKSEMIRNLDEIYEHQIGDDPSNWCDDVLGEKDLIPYKIPNLKEIKKNQVMPLYFAYFDNWDVNRNFEFLRKEIKFETHENNRSPGTFTNYDSLDDHIDSIYYYFQYLKFGFGRCWRDASRHIQLDKLSKKKAIDHIKKFDGELDSVDLEKTLKFLNISRIDFFDFVEKHRNEMIWKKSGNKFELINKLKL